MKSMWSKSAGAWRQVYPTPSVPTSVVLTAGEGASGVANLSWTASTVGYTTVASYELDQDGVVSDVGDVLLTQVTGLSDGTAYAFKVRAVAAFTGERGAWSNVVSVTPSVPYNDATGGTITTVDDYNGTGEQWRVHTFAANGTLNVTKATQPFRVLVVGGGGTGGTGCPNGAGGGGGGGGVYHNAALALTATAHTVTVGAGMPAFYGDVMNSPGGNPTTAFGITCGAGGGGGTGAWNGKKPAGGSAGGGPGSGGGGNGGASAGGTSGGGGGPAGSAGQNSGAYDITGTSDTYGEAGSYTQVGTYGKGGQPISAQGSPQGLPSGGGVVIVAYRIG